MAEPESWRDDHLVLQHEHGRGVTVLQAPAIATASVGVLDRVAAGDWPGGSLDGNVLTIDAINSRWRYRVGATLLCAAWQDRRVLTLVEGTPLGPSPQGAAGGAGAPRAPVVAGTGQAAPGAAQGAPRGEGG